MPVSQDDICEVCMETREFHGDKNHEFSSDGVLTPKKKPEPPKPGPIPRTIPDPTQAALLRLVERLISKELIQGDDLVYIFGGISGSTDRGPTSTEVQGDNSTSSTNGGGRNTTTE